MWDTMALMYCYRETGKSVYVKQLRFSFNCFFFFTLIMRQHLLTETVSNQSLMRKLLTSIFGNTNIFPFGTLACFWICKWQNFKVRLRKHFGGESGLHFHYGIKKCHMPAWRILHHLWVSQFLKWKTRDDFGDKEMVDLALGSAWGPLGQKQCLHWEHLL